MASAVAPDLAAGSDPRARADALGELVKLLVREGEALSGLDLDAIEAVQEEKRVLIERVERLIHAPARALPKAEAARALHHIAHLAAEARRLNVANAKLMARLGSTFGNLADVLRGTASAQFAYGDGSRASRFF